MDPVPPVAGESPLTPALSPAFGGEGKGGEDGLAIGYSSIPIKTLVCG